MEMYMKPGTLCTTHQHCSANGLRVENRYASRGLFTYDLNGDTDRFKEDLIEIFIFSLPPQETIQRDRRRAHHPSARAHYYLFMRFDEGTILGIYPNLFTLAVARNCLAFVRHTFGVRLYVRVFTSVQLRFHGVSPENSPKRISRHLAREPLGARPESLHEGRVAMSSEFARNRIAPSKRRPKN